MGSHDEETGSVGGDRRGTCLPFCLDITKCLPVLFIISIVSWSFYAFVIQLCLLTMTEVWLQILSLTIYHIFLILFLWSYWQTIFTKSGRVPRKFRISPSDLDRVESAQNEQEVNDVLDSIVRANQLPVLTRTNISQIRYCEKCSIIKPDRCHHCSVCGRCILKMDHHCPWVNNCVCFDNYKFFVLFLIYAFLYCVTIFIFSLPYFIQFWSRERNEIGSGGGKFHILFVFFVAAMFSVSLVSLFGYHCYLITRNRSTLESFRSPIFSDGPDTKGFSLGSYYNFVEIFGENKKTWFLPIFTSLGDGITFPTRQNRNPGVIGNYNSIDTTDASSSTSPDQDRCVGIRVDPKPDMPEPRSTATDLALAASQSNGGHSLGPALNGQGHLTSPPPPYSPTGNKNDSPLVFF